MLHLSFRALAGNLDGNESWRALEGTTHQQNITVLFENYYSKSAISLLEEWK